MGRRRLGDKNIRKITKVGGQSLSVTIPIEIARELRWRDGQKVVVEKKGEGVMVKDWKEDKSK